MKRLPTAAAPKQSSSQPVKPSTLWAVPGLSETIARVVIQLQTNRDRAFVQSNWPLPDLIRPVRIFAWLFRQHLVILIIALKPSPLCSKWVRVEGFDNEIPGGDVRTHNSETGYAT
jgi:hypothetical protein